jgi:hypothetical protein
MVLLGVLSTSSVILTRWGPGDSRMASPRPALSGVVD